jgi:hypothetical protein
MVRSIEDDIFVRESDAKTSEGEVVVRWDITRREDLRVGSESTE